MALFFNQTLLFRLIFIFLKLATVKDSTRNRSKDNNMFTHYVEAVAVQNRDRGNNTSSDDASNDNSTLPGQKGLVTFNHRDYLAINVILLNVQYVFIIYTIIVYSFDRKFTLNLTYLLIWSHRCVHQFSATKWLKQVEIIFVRDLNSYLLQNSPSFRIFCRFVTWTAWW